MGIAPPASTVSYNLGRGTPTNHPERSVADRLGQMIPRDLAPISPLVVSCS